MKEPIILTTIGATKMKNLFLIIAVLLIQLLLTSTASAIVIKNGETYQQDTSVRWIIDDLTIESDGTMLERGDGRKTWFFDGDYLIEGGIIETELKLDKAGSIEINNGTFQQKLEICRLWVNNTATISGGTFQQGLTITRSNMGSRTTISGGTFEQGLELGWLGIDSTTIISGGVFNQSMGIYLMQGDLVISGGKFPRMITGSTSNTSGAQPTATFIGSNWTLDNEPIVFSNGEAILPNSSQGILRGTLTDGNPISFRIGGLFAPVTTIIEVERPVAHAGEDSHDIINTVFSLDGSKSSAEQGGELTEYQWTLLQKPQGSVATLLQDSQMIAQLQPDVVGDYVVELVVVNGNNQVSDPAQVVITALPLPADPDIEQINFPDLQVAACVSTTAQQKNWVKASQVVELDCRNQSDAPKITELSGIEHFTQLERLFMPKNNISDISNLASLTKLKKLDLSDNPLFDISALAGLVNLQKLELNNTQIDDISPLRQMRNISTLVLSYNNIVDISPLNDMTEMKVLLIYNNHIENIEPLANMSQLQLLYLRYNDIKDVEPLANLSLLQVLDLGRNDITYIDALENLNNVLSINLAKNPAIFCSDLDTLSATLANTQITHDMNCQP